MSDSDDRAIARAIQPGQAVTPRLHPYAVLFVAVLAVSGAALFIRLAEAPPLVTGAWRLALASVPVLLLSFRRSKTARIGLTRRLAALCLLSGVFLALHFAFWITSLQHVSVMKSVVLVTTQPLFVAAASPLFLKETPSLLTLAGMCIAALGTAIMAAPGQVAGFESVAGYAFALLGALFAAGYFIVGRLVRGALSVGQYVSIVYPVAAAVLTGAALLSGASLIHYSGHTLLMFFLLALVPQLIGHTSLNWALRYLPATTVTVAVLGEPVGATALAAIFLAERPALLEASGAVIVLFGVYLALQSGRSALIPGRPDPAPAEPGGRS